MCRIADPRDLMALDPSLALDLRTIQGHHIIEQQQLKKHHLREYLWDERNGMGLCAYHHQRHTHFIERVPWELLPPAAFEFAEEVGLPWLLDQYRRAA